jgi:hypothetical protein
MRHKIITVGLIIQSAVCFFLITLVVGSVITTGSSLSGFEKYIGDKTYFTVHDTDDQAVDQYLKNENGDYTKLKNFMTAIQNQKNFTYLSIVSQPIDILTDKLPQKFIYGYETGALLTDAKDKDGNTKQAAKCLQVSSNVITQFGMKIDEGRGFLKEDYIYNIGRQIPVILGSDYKGIYSIGSTFDAYYPFDKMHFTVIGFFEKNTGIPLNERITYCDRYVVIPAFLTTDGTPDLFQRIILEQQSCGEIISNDSLPDIRSQIQSLITTTGTYQHSVAQPNASNIQNLVATSRESLWQLIYLSIAMVVFTIISVSVALNGFIRQGYYEYGVHLISGGTLRSIQKQIVGLIAVMMSIAFILSLIFIRSYYPTTTSLLASFGVCLLIFAISCIAPILKVSRIDINQLIRGKE